MPPLEIRTEHGQKLVDAMYEGYSAVRCVCGRAKQRRKAFCPKCNGATPKDLRMGLNSPDKLTMAQTYRDCMEWLEENGYLGKGATKSLFPGERHIALLSANEEQ